MTFKLSEAQRRLAEAMERADGLVSRSPGGFWGVSRGTTETWGVATVRSLEKLGAIERSNQFREEWRDPRRLTHAYRNRDGIRKPHDGRMAGAGKDGE